MVKKILSICIPCYNKAEHFPKLIEQLQSLSDIAEVCVFDNGSTDGLEALVNECSHGIKIKYHRVCPGGAIDYGWLSAVAMADCVYAKLQLGDDLPDAANIRDGLMQLISAPEKDFVLSKCSVNALAGERIPDGYFARADSLREQVALLDNSGKKADFVFKELSFKNRMGDINGLIFKSDALEGMSALIQSYYGFHTHPDSEIFLYLISNYEGMFFDKPFSTWTLGPKSPGVLRAKNRDFELKVYSLPGAIHTLLLLIDPGFSTIRKNVGHLLYWKVVVLYCARLFRIAKTSKKG